MVRCSLPPVGRCAARISPSRNSDDLKETIATPPRKRQRREEEPDIHEDVLVKCKSGRIKEYGELDTWRCAKWKEASDRRSQGPFFHGALVIAIADLEFPGLRPVVVPAGTRGVIKTLLELGEETVEVLWTSGVANGTRGAVSPRDLMLQHRRSKVDSPLRDMSGGKVLALMGGQRDAFESPKKRKAPSSGEPEEKRTAPDLAFFDLESARWTESTFRMQSPSQCEGDMAER